MRKFCSCMRYLSMHASATPFVGQRILPNFFVLYDAFLDASLLTVRAFLTMIREGMAVRPRSFNASATTGHIWCPVYHNLHKCDRQVVGRHTGREASLPPHTCTPCSFGKQCWNSCTVGHTELLHFATSGRIPHFDPYSDFILHTLTSKAYGPPVWMLAIQQEFYVFIIRIRMQVL